MVTASRERADIPDVGYAATIPQLLARAVRDFPDRPFVVSPEDQMTFAEAELRSRTLATHLLARGAGKASRIGLLMGNGPTWVVAFLAAARIGALVVPMSTFYTPEECKRALRQADVSILMLRETIAGRSARPLVSFLDGAVPDRDRGVILPEVPYLRHVLAVDAVDTARWESVSSYEPSAGWDLVSAIETEVYPSDLLSIILTSGTTGTQKAVMHTHGALVRQAWGLAQFQSIPSGRSTYTGAPFFWVGGLVPGVLTHLHVGGRLLTQERLDPDAMVEFMQRERPDVLFGFNLMDRLRLSDKFDDADADWLPAVGAGHRSPEDAARFHNTLGMSETAGAYSGPGAEAGRVLPAVLAGSFGSPMPGVEVKIVDPVTGLERPEDIEGEICLRTFSLMEGLYKKERRDVFDADGWFHTADLGRIRDGYLFFTGRLNDIIRTKGANISPEEVRAAIEKTDVATQVVVLGVADEAAGQIVAAVLVTPNPDSFDEGALRDQLKPLLSAYKIPKYFRAVEALPLLPSGKPNMVEMRGWFTTDARVVRH